MESLLNYILIIAIIILIGVSIIPSKECLSAYDVFEYYPPSCPPGYNYDNDKGMCYDAKTAAHKYKVGYDDDANLYYQNDLEYSVCPGNYNYDMAKNVCYDANVATSKTCPPSYIYDSRGDLCYNPEIIRVVHQNKI